MLFRSTDFGTLLRVLRHRARLTQRQLGIAVGYSEAQISRLEQRRRRPDPAVVAALFLPALRLGAEPELAARLNELAAAAAAARHRIVGRSPQLTRKRRQARTPLTWPPSRRRPAIMLSGPGRSPSCVSSSPPTGAS